MRARGQRLTLIGGAGSVMLVAALGLILATGGLSFLAVLALTLRRARAVPHMATPRLCVVLGKALRHGGIDQDFRARLDAAHAIYRQCQRLPIIILGGRSSARQPSEAAAGAEHLRVAGVAGEDLLREEHSRHTLENLRHLRERFGAITHGAALITSRYHVARVEAMSRTLGLASVCVGAEPELRLDGATMGHLGREAFLLHWYLTGKALARGLRWRHALSRIS
jgi:vancomycin permeability regulator SanA